MENSLPKDNTMSKQPINTWKQWLLIYPTFAVAVLGAIPQYIEVIKGFNMGVDANQVSYAENQNELWMKNHDCNLSFNTIETIANSRVSIGACPSGDIQINITYPDDSTFIRWLGFDELREDTFSHNGLLEGLGISTAVAEEIQPLRTQSALSDVEVMCQKMLSTGRVVRIIRAGESCHKETVNTYTGKVQDRKIVECSSTC